MRFLKSRFRPRPLQLPKNSGPSQQKATLSIQEKRAFLAEKSKHNTRRILFFSLFCAYALLAVLGTSDYDLLLERPIEIPGLRISLPLLTFYFVTPLAILLLHFGVLWMHDRYCKELEKIPRETIREIPFSILDAPYLDASSIVRWSVNFLVYLFPPVVLAVFFFRFADYQSVFLTFWHLFLLILCLIIDPLLIHKNKYSGLKRLLNLGPTRSGFILFFILFFIFFCLFLQYPFLFRDYPSRFLKPNQMKFLLAILPRLEVTHCNLNEDFDLNEAKAYRELDNEERKKTYLFYTTKVDLRNRNFIMADMSYSKMVNFDFSGSNLRGVNLGKSQLQYSSFNSAKLKKACLFNANLQGAELMDVNLQGADLRTGNLQGARLGEAEFLRFMIFFAGFQWTRGANLQGASPSFANLQGAVLTHAILQGADLTMAYLQGAYAGEDYKNFVDRIGKPTQLSLLGDKKFTSEDCQRIIKIIESFKPFLVREKHINLVKQAVEKTSLEWLEMQKGKYITGVLTWEEACKIQKKVTSPEARWFMGLYKVNWKEKCK